MFKRILWLGFLAVVSQTALAYGPLPSTVPTGDVYAAAGYLKATYYAGVDPTGQSDSTVGLKNALNDAYDYGLALLLPSGVYRVSDTLQRDQHFQYSGCAEFLYATPYGIHKAPVFVGEPGSQRPVIKLANSSSGFTDANSHKPVVYFHNDGEDDCAMELVFRGIDIDLGSGNAGAIGLSMPSAQNSTIEDVKITATGAYAGIVGTPTTDVVANVEIVGGQYGIRLEVCCGATLAGIRLGNQVVAGIYLADFSEATITGFDITESTAVPIQNDYWSSQTSEVVLLDGSITITGPGSQPAISNPYGNTIWASNVFIATVGNLVQSGSTSVGSVGAISKISEYAYANTQVDNANGFNQATYNLINGTTGQNQIVSVQAATAVPTHLVDRHLIGRIPWFADSNVVNVESLGAVGDGVTDSTAAIQAAINQSDYVFLPRGDYAISGTLSLNANTHLFGVSGERSRLFAPNWNTQGQLAPYIRSADSATGTAYLGDLAIDLPPGSGNSSYLSGIDWQTGRNSIVRQVSVVAMWTDCADPSTGCLNSAARKLVNVRNSGGGRWYGLGLAQDGGAINSSGLRALSVDGTSAPLTFYGANPEHELAAPFVEINGASNVRFLGMKTENTTVSVANASNVMIAGHTGNDDYFPMLTVSNSQNVLSPVFTEYDGFGSQGGSHVLDPAHPYIVYDAVNGTGISGNDRVGVFKLGSFDASVFESSTAATGTACLAEEPVIADGNISDWIGVASKTVSHTQYISGIGSMPASDADSSATFQVQWDANNLYVLVRVRDDIVAGTASDPWLNDSVELYLNGGDETGTSYDTNDYQLVVDWRGYVGGTRSNALTFSATAAVTTDGYNVEYSIPWSALGGAPSAGRKIGIDVAVNDNDGSGRKSQIVWHGNGDGWFNPATFGQYTMAAAVCQSGACNAPTPPTIDGSAADWNAIAQRLIAHTRSVAAVGGMPSSDADSSAAFRVKWDASNLYVLVEVRDDVVTGSSTTPYLNDSVELYLDGGDEAATSYDSNDYQLTVDHSGNVGGVRSGLVAFVKGVTATAQGFNVEYAIPWSALRVPSAGAYVGIDVAVNDSDGGNGVRDSQIVWNGNGNGYFDPSTFGRIRLSAASCP